MGTLPCSLAETRPPSPPFPPPPGRSPQDLARGLGERDLRSLSRELKGVRVLVDRPGGKKMRKTIWGLSKARAGRLAPCHASLGSHDAASRHCSRLAAAVGGPDNISPQDTRAMRLHACPLICSAVKPRMRTRWGCPLFFATHVHAPTCTHARARTWSAHASKRARTLTHIR